ncbi:hypothetical protein J437_LFUL011985 [Ladona fulva]|uniref:Uncharacterized protein n=1 Tax=Ladona fulva TaxID=123851 RepID=A0A8K0P7K0_LADFU|nr:hypothetical protein J437_LFUL011985 [Ladona fulva]
MADNYRPLSLKSDVCKVFQRLVSDYLTDLGRNTPANPNSYKQLKLKTSTIVRGLQPPVGYESIRGREMKGQKEEEIKIKEDGKEIGGGRIDKG